MNPDRPHEITVSWFELDAGRHRLAFAEPSTRYPSYHRALEAMQSAIERIGIQHPAAFEISVDGPRPAS